MEVGTPPAPATPTPDASSAGVVQERPLPPPQPLVLGPSKDPTPAPAQSAGPGPVKGPTAGSDDQVQFIPKKETLKYPNLGSNLNRLVASVEAGQATAGEAARGAAIHQDGSVAVTIHLSGKPDAVVKFLEDKGGDPRNVGEDYIEAYVPVTLLGALSERPGVLRVREIVPPQPAGPARP